MASASASVPTEAGLSSNTPRNGPGKRQHQNNHRHESHQKRVKKRKQKPIQEGSSEEVLQHDVQLMLASYAEPAGGDNAENVATPEAGSEIDVEVIELSSTGDGLARYQGQRQIYVVPFTVPGDTVRIKVYRYVENHQYWVGDFISVTKPSPLRDDSRIQCQYFSKCSGCQFQMLDYAEQLKLKKRIVEKAYRNFSQLPPELVPQILDTMGSPLQYGYRTKLTPHFDGPPGFNRRGYKKALESMPDFGFTPKNSRRVLDIEDCPIGTDAVRKGLKQERERLAVDFGKYQRGATILLRESTKRVPKHGASSSTEEAVPEDAIKVEEENFTDYKTCITDNNATSTEYIDDFIFTNPAGAFFQNNNSILPPFTDYIRQHILPPRPPPPTSSSSSAPPPTPVKYLIDAYSGSGLFTIAMASLFPGGSTGIDIADKSIAFARRNARLNGLDEAQCRFIAADAPQLFKSVSAYGADETVVVIDPPRKGCDASFLRQLLRFAPRRVVYVSCNVHTQARDVGVLVRGEVEGGGGEDDDAVKEDGGKEEGAEGADKPSPVKTRYEIESIRGFDFFPQTGHVEGVAVLNRVA